MKIKAKVVQCPTVSDTDENIRKIEEHAKDVDIVVFPEYFLNGFWFGMPPLKDEHINKVREIARRRNTYIATGGMLNFDGANYDCLLFFHTDGKLDVYRKKHLFIFDAPMCRPWHETKVCFTEFGKIGLGICYDMLFEDVWADYRGSVDLVVISSAWPDFIGSWLKFGPLKFICPRTSFSLKAKICVYELPFLISRFVGAPVLYSNYCGLHTIKLPGGEYGFRWVGGSAIVSDRYHTLFADEGELTKEVELKRRPPGRKLKPESMTSPIAKTILKFHDILVESILRGRRR